MEEIVIPEDFEVRIRIKRGDKEDVVIDEPNGLELKFDIGIALRNSPPNDARCSYMASFLTQRWADKLEGHTIAPSAATGIWGLLVKKEEALKKNS